MPKNEKPEDLTAWPTARPHLGIQPVDEVMGVTVKPIRRGRLTQKGIDQRLLLLQAGLEKELAKLARQFKRVERFRKQIQRLRSQRMTATEV